MANSDTTMCNCGHAHGQPCFCGLANRKDSDQTTAFVIYNPRGMEIAVCLNRATAEAITDRAYGCYLRELPIAEDVSALERFRR